MSKALKVTELDENGKEKQGLVFFGTGGAIKATRFDEDNTTELYNAEGNMVAKVREDISTLQMLANQ